jgi:DNA-binding MarR family transcriptional regulator
METVPRARKKAKRAAPTKGDDLHLRHQLCFPLYAAARMMVNAYRPILGPMGITYPQYLVLLALWETDGLSVSAIGERLYLDSGTLTPLLKRLAAQGLIARRRSEKDDRVVGNWLTPSGAALRARATRIPATLLCNAQLDLAEVGPMKQILERLVAALLPLQPGAGDGAGDE